MGDRVHKTWESVFQVLSENAPEKLPTWLALVPFFKENEDKNEACKWLIQYWSAGHKENQDPLLHARRPYGQQVYKFFRAMFGPLGMKDTRGYDYYHFMVNAGLDMSYTMWTGAPILEEDSVFTKLVVLQALRKLGKKVGNLKETSRL